MISLDRIRLYFLNNCGDVRFDIALILLLSSSFLGYLSLRGWMNADLILLFLLSLGCWVITRGNKRLELKALRIVVLVLVLPLLAILFSQGLRNDWIAKAYDTPMRMFISIPVLACCYIKRVEFTRLISVSVPAALIILLAQVYLDPAVTMRWFGRFATYFVDCDTFGIYTLVMSALCMFCLAATHSRFLQIWLTVGTLVGLYLLIGSKTRSAWLALPFVLALWLVLKGNTWGWRKTASLLGTFILVIAVAGIASPNTLERLQSGFNEVAAWMNGSNLDTSAGLRLTMWHMSWVLFQHSPLYGYGDFGYRNLLDAPWITSISTLAARQTISAGPHNEILANLLRSGIFGGISIISYFVLLLIFFWRERNHPDNRVTSASHLGLVYLVCMFITSIEFEVFTLKYTASFNGFMIAGLAAQVAWAKAKYTSDKLAAASI